MNTNMQKTCFSKCSRTHDYAGERMSHEPLTTTSTKNINSNLQVVSFKEKEEPTV